MADLIDRLRGQLLLPLPRTPDERAELLAIQATAPLRELLANPDRWRDLLQRNLQTALAGGRLP